MKSKKTTYKFGDFLFRFRGVIPVAFLVVALYVRYFNTARDASYQTYYDLSCLFIALIGLGIRVHVVGHSPKGTSGRNKGRQLAEQLNTKGSYSIVRHPLYFANFLIWLAVALLGQSTWLIIAFLGLISVFYGMIISTEERFLKQKFGPLYMLWKKDTPTIVPNPFQYESSLDPFNLKKVIRKEKNGVAALFLVFFLFQVADAMALELSLSQFLVRDSAWAIAMIFSSLYYIVIKLINKKTDWLTPK